MNFDTREGYVKIGIVVGSALENQSIVHGRSLASASFIRVIGAVDHWP